MKRRAPIAACVLAGLAATVACAADPKLDAELLEFLGSLDADDEEFIGYLEQRPVERKSGAAAGKAPAKAPEPAKPADPKQVKKS